MSLNVSNILNSVAVGLDAMDAGIADPKVSAGIKAAALLVRTLAGVTSDRTAEESIALLEQLRDQGTKAIGQNELDAQTAKILAE